MSEIVDVLQNRPTHRMDLQDMYKTLSDKLRLPNSLRDRVSGNSKENEFEKNVRFAVTRLGILSVLARNTQKEERGTLQLNPKYVDVPADMVVNLEQEADAARIRKMIEDEGLGL